MPTPAHRLLLIVATTLFCATGCIDNTVDPELTEVDFLVGEWEADEMLMISDADPDRIVDLIQAFDASFNLSVEPSGRYEASLSLGGGTPLPETGYVSVAGDSLVFRNDNGTESRARYELQDDGSRLILDGPGTFDFDGDLEEEPATLHLELFFL